MGDRNRQAWSDRFTSLLAIVESAQELCHDNAATPDQALDEVSNSEKRRFEARIDDPRRLWKLCHSARRQYDYPLARVITVKRTPTRYCHFEKGGSYETRDRSCP